MNYSSLIKLDTANGLGLRTTIFVSGCNLHCKGCFNPDAQAFDFGQEVTDETINTIINYIDSDYINGLSILGGEPLDQNPNDMKKFLSTIRPHLKDNQNIWLWSGHTFEEILKDKKRLEIIKYVDVLVDGPFISKLKDVDLRFRGSSNQRILDCKASIKKREPVIYCLEN
jgi:anaerobic ribonucleoside-triphosphate reductase activating protein